MSVTDVQASLAIYGEGRGLTAGAVTAALGIEPTSSYEVGDPIISSSPALAGKYRANSYWTFEIGRTLSSDEDPHGMESLVRLAELFEPKAEVLAGLSRHYLIRVWMLAFSDSTQGGFVIGPETMRRLGTLSASFFGDIYLSEDDIPERI
jgi:hypothetical protein